MNNRDYSSISDDLVRAYNAGLNTRQLATNFRISHMTCRRLLREKGVCVLKPGERMMRKFDPESCRYCHKYSPTGTINGYCMKHRRAVLGYSIEICFVK